MMSRNSSFLKPKILVTFECGHSQQGHQIQAGELLVALFNQYFAISQKMTEMVQNKDTVSREG